MTSHELFDAYEPTLDYRSYFQYSRIPSINAEDDSLKTIAPQSGFKQLISFFIIIFGYLLVLSTFPVTGWFAIKRVKSLQRCLVYRLGERRQLKGPGLIFVLPCIDSVDFIDLEKEEFSVVQNESFLTADGSLIEIQQFRVSISVANAIKSFTKLKDSHSNVKEFIRLTFKNLITSSRVDDFDLKLDSIISSFASDCNFYLNNWGWQMDIVELPKIVVKSKAEQKNPIVSVLKSFFNSTATASSNGNPSQMFLNNLYGLAAGNLSNGINSNETNTGCNATDSSTVAFDDNFMAKLEQVPPRYLHMNVFHFNKFNIKITIGNCSAFFVYLVDQKTITKVQQIDEAIHFDVKCQSMQDFHSFTDHNDSSKIEITTKLF